MKNFFRLSTPYLLAIGFFAIITLFYCFPVLQGKMLSSHDNASWRGMYQEAKLYNEKTGEYTDWTNSMFSGMPTYQIGGGATSYPIMQKINDFASNISLLFMPSIALQITLYLLGFFALLLAFGCNIWLAVAGSLAISFSSYFFIILGAGHETKALAIGFFAFVLAGFKLIYDRKYAWGAFLVALYALLGLVRHPQMAYYIFMLIGILFFAELWKHIQEKKLKRFFISSLIFIGALGIGIGAQAGYIIMNQHYVKETMRGGHSELNSETAVSKNAGLDLDYATAWSYGIDESWTFLIPNFKGGASGAALSESSNTSKALIANGYPKSEAKRFCQQMPMYWGTQPFTSGPVYMGAIVCFLFVLGLFIVKGPYKWALLVATLFSLFLSWGKNFMPLTEFFMNYFPYYNKFRAVSSILIVAEITIPLLGFLALKNIIQQKVEKVELLKKLKLSVYLTGGACLFFAILGPSIFGFTCEQDISIFKNFPQWLSDAIVEDRKAWLRMDAFRSAVFIGIAFVALFYFIKGKIKSLHFYIALIALILLDMWPVDKRYLNNDMFVAKNNVDIPFQMSNVDRLILQDPDPHYRVLNVTTNTFNDAATSYFHKSIGGYSPAKLRRYQDMIEYHIGRNNVKVFNMLNTKYFIVPGQDGTADVQRNVAALGNAWFIDSIRVVNGPKAEIDALYAFEPASVAVVDTPFSKNIQHFLPADSSASILLTSYAPNKLTYKSHNTQNGLAVFSEVFYPNEWFAYIDGKPAEILRVNYILRAINIPAGEHEITMEFIPIYKKQGENIGLVFNILIYLLLASALFLWIGDLRKNKTLS